MDTPTASPADTTPPPTAEEVIKKMYEVWGQELKDGLPTYRGPKSKPMSGCSMDPSDTESSGSTSEDLPEIPSPNYIWVIAEMHMFSPSGTRTVGFVRFALEPIQLQRIVDNGPSTVLFVGPELSFMEPGNPGLEAVLFSAKGS